MRHRAGSHCTLPLSWMDGEMLRVFLYQKYCVEEAFSHSSSKPVRLPFSGQTDHGRGSFGMTQALRGEAKAEAKGRGGEDGRWSRRGNTGPQKAGGWNEGGRVRGADGAPHAAPSSGGLLGINKLF